MLNHSSSFLQWIALTLGILFAAPTLAGVVTIQPTPSNPTGNCNQILTEIANLPTTSDHNRWTIQLEPGVYDCASQTINLPDWVSLFGAGQASTEIRGTGNPVLIEAGSRSEVGELQITLTPDTPDSQSIGVRATKTQFRIEGVKLTIKSTLTNVDCIGVENSKASGAIASSYIREIQVDIQCSGDNTGILASGVYLPMIQRVYVMAANGLGTNIALDLDLQTPSESFEFRDSIFDAYGPNAASATTANAIAIDFEGSRLKWAQFFNTYAAAKSAQGLNVGLRAGGFLLVIFNSQIASRVPGASGPGSDCLSGALGIAAVAGPQGQAPIVSAQNTHIYGSSRSLCTTASGGSFTVTSGQVGGGPILGTAKCGGVVDEVATFYSSTCP